MNAPTNTLLVCRDATGRAFNGMLTKLGWVELRGRNRVLCDQPAAWSETHKLIETQHGTDPWWIRNEIEKQVNEENP